MDNFDKTGFDAVMKQLSEAGDNGFKLTLQAGSTTKWRLPGSDLYFDVSPAGSQGHSLTHIFTHTIPGFKSGAHSVFTSPRAQLIQQIRDSWSNRTIRHPTDTFRWEVDAGTVIGTAGETKIRIIVNPNTNQIISAYPILDTESYL